MRIGGASSEEDGGAGATLQVKTARCAKCPDCKLIQATCPDWCNCYTSYGRPPRTILSPGRAPGKSSWKGSCRGLSGSTGEGACGTGSASAASTRSATLHTFFSTPSCMAGVTAN